MPFCAFLALTVSAIRDKMPQSSVRTEETDTIYEIATRFGLKQ